MTNPLIIREGERHTLRVFSLDMSKAEVKALEDPAVLLGLPGLEPVRFDLIELADLEGVGLTRYLIEGSGGSEGQIAADRGVLDGLAGFVLILRSPNDGVPAAVLRPDPRLRLIGFYTEDVPPVTFEPLPEVAAEGLLPQGKPVMSDARIGGMVATVVLVLMFVMVAVVIWMAA